MMTILQNRAKISQALEEEMKDKNALRKHVPVSVVREIVQARERGMDISLLSSRYNVDPSVVEKLGDQIAVPVDNADGIVHSI
jgi:hypothetical protein